MSRVSRLESAPTENRGQEEIALTMMRDVLIIVTGGTIEKVHDWQSETVGFDGTGATQVPAVLADARCHHPRVHSLLMKDSLEFTDADRVAILDCVTGSPEQAIIISHGTGTMGKTARFLDGKQGGKTVILTGAMRPHSFGSSDASFNMGGAVVAAQVLPAGVFGCMNGRIIEAGRLEKNTALGRFDVAE